MNAGYTIDHVAIVVGDLDAAIELYAKVLRMPQIYRETIAEQGVETVGFQAGESVIELLRPLDPDSAVSRFRGDAPTRMHHIAYQVPDLEGELARLRAAGIRLIDETPRRGAHGNRIAFLHPKSTGGVLVELCRRDG